MFSAFKLIKELYSIYYKCINLTLAESIGKLADVIDLLFVIADALEYS